MLWSGGKGVLMARMWDDPSQIKASGFKCPCCRFYLKKVPSPYANKGVYDSVLACQNCNWRSPVVSQGFLITQKWIDRIRMQEKDSKLKHR